MLPRGSDWLRWEPHIHVPGTLFNDGYSTSDWEPFIAALESATPSMQVIGVTDYCVTRSYERLLAEKTSGKLASCSLLFPNIELRLNTGTVKGNFVNIHLLVCPDDPNHVAELNRFLGQLVFPAFNDRFACTPSDLMRLGRKFDNKINDDESALRAGASQFKISRENLEEALAGMEWAQKNIIIAVSANADGTSGVRDAADTTIREEIEKIAHAIFASSSKQRDFWLGYGAAGIDELRIRYDGAKPCLWGCDAHQLSNVGKPAEDRLCWLKGTPTFDTLRQACIDPERAYVGPTAPAWISASQTIDTVEIHNAPWLSEPAISLNPGLVAIIGARGSGKTALGDIIAAGCDSYKSIPERPSFLERAKEYLAGSNVTLKWRSGIESPPRDLANPLAPSWEVYPKARYLSQQFVEHLCSLNGMPELLREIERVIFEAHTDKDGSINFEELRNLRVRTFRESRRREELALANISDEMGVELDKMSLVESLKAQILEKDTLLKAYDTDRIALLPKTASTAQTTKLQQLLESAEVVRGNLRYFTNQQVALTSLANTVLDVRQNRAPEALRHLKTTYQASGFTESEWPEFLLHYGAGVDTALSTKLVEAERNAAAWKGNPPTTPVDDTGAFISEGVDPKTLPLAIVEAEIKRVEGLVATDRDTAVKLANITKRIGEESAAVAVLRDKLKDCEGAKARRAELSVRREAGYKRVFDAILAEQGALSELYAPLVAKLSKQSGSLSKLSFVVTRTVNVKSWADKGEKEIFDLRGGPFRGFGSLQRVATEELKTAWESGDSSQVSLAMQSFRDKYQDPLLEKGPSKADAQNYRSWSRRFAQWLYSTNHISIEYGIRYDGIDIQKLSPGTRGVVLILLYLALDEADDRPLIIDQPEENLDPQSIYNELVPLFLAAKRKRQVIMVTHNANLVVNTDADQIIIASVGPQPGNTLPTISYVAGGLEEPNIRKAVCDILEGGEAAFRDRARRLHISFKR